MSIQYDIWEFDSSDDSVTRCGGAENVEIARDLVRNMTRLADRDCGWQVRQRGTNQVIFWWGAAADPESAANTTRVDVPDFPPVDL